MKTPEQQSLEEYSDEVLQAGLPEGTPSPREIRKRSLAIQEHWTEPEERQRRTGLAEEDPLDIPVIGNLSLKEKSPMRVNLKAL